MWKILVKLSVVTSLGLISLIGIWFPFAIQPRPAQAKEAIEAAQFPHSAEPGARPLSAGFNITVSQIISSGFVNPVQVTHAGDGSNRLFVVEQYGRIRIINSPVATPFLDIRSIVRSPEPGDNGGSEEGLLGLAFHPGYESNGHFYVYYNDNSSDIVIARYTVSGNPDIADSGSASIILPISHPGQTNHNGGQLAFSPVDGYLYISTGDGGSANAQNIDKLLGKILRLDVDGGTPYAIPNGNPFKGATPGADEIWALGLRNPWRYSFDRGSSTGTGKGDLYIGDVGQGTWEEISYQAAGTLGGLNYGWDIREGPCPTGQAQPCAAAPAQFTDPIAFYVNAGDNIAVTGGFVYRGSLYPALRNYYFYADFGSGRIWSIQKTGSTFSTPEEELNTDLSISAFGEDEQGEVYVVDYGGKIYRLADIPGPFSTYLPVIFK